MSARTYTKEADVKAEIKKILKAAGWYWWMPPGNGYGKAGVSDFNGIREGVFLAVEAKFGTRKPTAQQVNYLRSVRAAGGVAVVVCEKRLDDFCGLLWMLANRPFDPKKLETAPPMQRMIQEYIK